MLFVASPAAASPALEPPSRQRWAAAAGWEAPRSAAGPTTGLATAAAAAVAVAVGLGAWRGRRGEPRTLRRLTYGGLRDYEKEIEDGQEWGEPTIPYPEPRKFWPGQNGYSNFTPPCKVAPNPARQSLSQINEAMAYFLPSDFYKEPFAELKASAVKEVGSCMTRPDAPDVIVVPAEVPAYVKPRTGLRLEKEQGDKRRPLEDADYIKYMDKRSTLAEAAKTTASKASFSLEKDFIADRSALTLLLNYLSDALSPELKAKGQSANSLDLVKITKSPNGKGLVLERTFEKKNLWAEWRPYRGTWRRSEVSQKGSYFPAWERVATGDTSKKCVMITGLRQISGKRAGLTPNSYRFCEFDLGGLSFLTRTPTHATHEGKSVELKTKNFFYQGDVTLLNTYYNLILGGVGMLGLGIQRSGKLVQVVEADLDQIIAKNPEVVQAAERRMGRLVSLLKKVKAAVESSGDDGPWVLQWQFSKLILGKYELVEPVEEMEEEPSEVEPEDIMTPV